VTERYRFSQTFPKNACTVLQITPRLLHILWIHWYIIMKIFDTIQWFTDVVASYDRSTASYKANSQQYPLVSSRSFNSCLCLLPPLPVTLSFPLYFLQLHVVEGSSRARCDHFDYPSFHVLYIWRSFPIWLFLTRHFSRGRSNWSSPSFYSTTFQNFPGISELLSEVSKFQHHTQLCSKFISSPPLKKKIGSLWNDM
jgi:hypothetical protein